ncbi:MAG: hypothetical protein EON97_00740 [Chitinophagaceae bacterium]|nr:MAG: hypothetical protein EON97_00740 [Chitinophagaceae bacterium]
MDFIKRNWKTMIAMILIVALSWIESQFFTESTGIGENSRKAMHLVFLFAIQVTGYLYWFGKEISWMKHLWTVVYAGMFLILIGVGLLNWKFDLFGSGFLDQVRVLRTFFSSPLPFIGTLAFAEIFTRHQGAPARLNLK